ncbi:efflux RND transporter periplasmic adaptor subunit [Thioflexithrix psekupsensis]|uniref:Membrane fusion protein biotin-lipoyl like domain-containing protein n=1 Tax=Thioflexithrix psekupsensis TaxID=1570016 RepID=A0A251XBS1_9GAMM|nr:HlyD family efflux transporter periplasmic adaptor subunit [Thioflexithrix psekupsensis]OUD16177.1 hypothetical protein TPSD3_00160 [Thioflexithrix psekupsensis]
MRFKVWLPFLILAVGGLGLVWLIKTRPPAQPIEAKEQVWTVDVVTVQPQAQHPQVMLYGRVESPQATTLRIPPFSQNSALTVTQVVYLAGDSVKKGDLLLKLDDNEARLLLEQREAEVQQLTAQIDNEKIQHDTNIAALKQDEILLNLAENHVKRVRQLEQKQASSQSAVDDANKALAQQQLSLLQRKREIRSHPARLAQLQANLKKAQAQASQARLEVERTVLRAPFDARLAQVSVSSGDRVRVGDVAVTLYDPKTLEVRSQIPARYQGIVLEQMQKNQLLTAKADWQGHEVNLQLARVAGEIQAKTGGIDALFTVTSQAELLRLGQFLTPILRLPAEDNVSLLPFSAIYGTNRLYKWVDGRMQSVAVNIIGEQSMPDGRSVGVLVRSEELHAGDQVIVTQLPNAINGLRVQTRIE